MIEFTCPDTVLILRIPICDRTSVEYAATRALPDTKPTCAPEASSAAHIALNNTTINWNSSRVKCIHNKSRMWFLG